MGSAWDKVSQEMNTNKEELDVFKAKIEESGKGRQSLRPSEQGESRTHACKPK